MEEKGIGTDATRATYPKLIIDRGYTIKESKTFKPTELGMRLIELLESVDERLVTPETRRRVEELMAEIEAGKMGYEEQNTYHSTRDWRTGFDGAPPRSRNRSRRLSQSILRSHQGLKGA